jgi:hypothetical protein
MRIFLSYASEQSKLAERIELTLRNEGHTVFFDRSSLPEGESFDSRIRKAIRRCSLFIFLISRNSIAAGAYALTELEMAKRRWKRLSGRLLPVIVDNVEIAQAPAPLSTLNVLRPAGNLVAEVSAAVSRIHHRRQRTLFGFFLAALAVIATVSVFAYSHYNPPENSVPSEGGSSAINISIPEGYSLRSVIRGILEDEGFSVAFQESCTTEILSREVSHGTVRGDDLRDLIEQIPYRLREPEPHVSIHGHPTGKGKYEISCEPN